MDRKVTLFCQTSIPGLALGASIVSLGNRLGVEVEVRDRGDYADFRIACVQSEAVIIDLSAEPNGQNTYNYLIEEHRFLDHILVVSRTHLPINVNPQRVGGAPVYPFPDREIPGYSWSNSDILSWLRRELEELLQEPRKHLLNLPIEHPDFSSALNRNLILMVIDAKQQKKRRESSQPTIFLSYRGQYFGKVQKLAQQIETGKWHPGQKPKMILLTPGQLALEWEYLTEVRRWQVLGMLEELIEQCSEVWIYKSSNYLESWWTIGELVCTHYAQYMWDIDQSWTPGPKIRLYDPSVQQITDDVPSTYLLAFGKKERAHLDRMLSVAAQAEMDINKLKRNALFARWYKVFHKIGLSVFLTRMLRKVMVAQNQQTADHMPQEDRAGFNESSEQRIAYWTNSNDLHFQLSNPLFKDEAWIRLGTNYHEQFWDTVNKQIDLDRFFDCDTRLKKAIPLSDLKHQKEIVGSDGKRFPVVEYPPRLYWEAVDGEPARLLEIPTYAAW